ncbi:MAG: hypothetical protein IJ509_00225 [Bacilli bacterium]|nr:hypothetical protein [Bacilli bacterium]
MENEVIIAELINFFVVAVIFLVVLAVAFRIFCKHFRFNDKNVEIYGLLLNLNTSSLVSIATITINYLFLVWWMISFKGVNVIYIAITLVLVLISEAVIDNFKGLPLSMLLSAVNCAAVQVIYLIYQYVTVEEFSYLLLIVLGLVVLFVFLYFTYNLFRQINNIVIKHKYLKHKKYTV